VIRKHVLARRQKLRELAEQDAANRCRHCKTVLERVRVQMGEPFCSTDCEDDHLAFLARWEAAKAKVAAR